MSDAKIYDLSVPVPCFTTETTCKNSKKDSLVVYDTYGSILRVSKGFKHLIIKCFKKKRFFLYRTEEFQKVGHDFCPLPSGIYLKYPPLCCKCNTT